MTRTKILLSGSAVALGAALAFTPTAASAQGATCATFAAGLIAQPAQGNTGGGGSNTACGVGATTAGGAINATAIGAAAFSQADNETSVGALSGPIGVGVGVGSTNIGTGAGFTNGDAGINSVSLGFGASGTGGGAVAIGAGVVASGLGSVGVLSAASGFHSVVVGPLNVEDPLADHSTIVGSHNSTGAFGSQTAIGQGNNANGSQATAVGTNNDATANGATVLGNDSTASGVNSVAIGSSALADGDDSVAIGTGASNATFTNSVALGAGSTNTANNQVNVGGRKINGVTAATLSAASTEAVNGSQLFATNNNITNLQGDVADLQAQDIVLANRIHRTDRRASGGTAVAIAMGGNMFLPDKTFNLTGNVGLYRSQVAAAVNIGAMVGSGAAFNAGIGSGFNHNGRFGARAGFTFGW